MTAPLRPSVLSCEIGGVSEPRSNVSNVRRRPHDWQQKEATMTAWYGIHPCDPDRLRRQIATRFAHPAFTLLNGEDAT